MKWTPLRFGLLTVAIHSLFWVCVTHRANIHNIQLPFQYDQMIAQLRGAYAEEWFLYLALGACFALLGSMRVRRAYQLALEGMLILLPFLFYSICTFLPTFSIKPPAFSWKPIITTYF